MFYDRETPEYTLRQMMRFHGINLHHYTSDIRKAALDKNLGIAQEAVQQLQSGLGVDSNGALTSMTGDRRHYLTTINVLKTARQAVIDAPPFSDRISLRQILTRCIYSCLVIIDTINKNPEVPSTIS